MAPRCRTHLAPAALVLVLAGACTQASAFMARPAGSLVVQQVAAAGLRKPSVAMSTVEGRKAVAVAPSDTVPFTSVTSAGRPLSPLAEPPKHTGILTPCELYANVVAMGARKAKLVSTAPMKTAVLGVAAGMYISIGALLAITIGANCPGLVATNHGLQKLVYGAIGLPFGLFFVLVCGGELFTGNTAAMTAAVIERRATVKQLLLNWAVSFSTNLASAVCVAWLVVHSGVVFNPAAAMGMAVSKTSLTFGAAFIRGMFCNWLVCQAMWMAAGATGAMDKFIAIWLPITAFTAIGFEHSIANCLTIPLGILLGAPVSWSAFFLKNLLPVTLGNIIGGAFGMSGLYSLVYGGVDQDPESRYL